MKPTTDTNKNPSGKNFNSPRLDADLSDQSKLRNHHVDGSARKGRDFDEEKYSRRLSSVDDEPMEEDEEDAGTYRDRTVDEGRRDFDRQSNQETDRNDLGKVSQERTGAEESKNYGSDRRQPRH